MRALGWEPKEVSARWLKASRALKKEDQIYRQKLAEMVKSTRARLSIAFDDPLEAAIICILVKLTKEAIANDLDL